MTQESCNLDRREELRRGLRQQRNFRFIDAKEFEALIVSPSRLERHDDQVASLRGLRDPQSGLCFVTEAEKVLQDRRN